MSLHKMKVKSKERRVTCHFCLKTMLEQHFSAHMKTIHKSSETRDASQMPLTLTFQPKPKKMPRLDNREGEIEQGKIDNIESGIGQDFPRVGLCGQDENLSEVAEKRCEEVEISKNTKNVQEREHSSADTNAQLVLPVRSDSEDELKNEIAILKADVAELKESIEFVKEGLRMSGNEGRTSVVLPKETFTPADDESILRRCKTV